MRISSIIDEIQDKNKLHFYYFGLMWEYSQMLTISVHILTDTELKESFLQARNKGVTGMGRDTYFGPQAVLLFDEVDDMYDASKSTLNIVREQQRLQPGLVRAVFRLAAFVLGQLEIGVSEDDTPLTDDFTVQFCRLLLNGTLGGTCTTA